MSIAASPNATDISVNTLDALVHQLGDIPLDRIVTKPPIGTATEEDLLNCPLKCELVDGTLVVKAMGYHESVLASILIQWINNYLDKYPLGACAGEQGICLLIPGLIRAPDVSFISSERIAAAKGELTFAPGAPDLCVEVLSKKNTRREISRKLEEYFRHGARLVWVLDHRKETAEVYSSPVDPLLVQASDRMDGGGVLPGFQFILAELYDALNRRLAGIRSGQADEPQT